LRLDLTGVQCPMNWVHVKLALEKLSMRESLVVVLDPGEAVESVSASAREDGHSVVVEGTRLTIVKGAG
jgi:TusA-related sulfurtransferase